MTPLLGLCLLLQQGTFLGATTPPSGDTVGYWQQRVAYTMVATLDEPRSVIHARGELVYVNNSPDTLKEMYFHQYLNAFRPASAWSASDAHENRDRFQDLQDPNYGYERFTAAPTVNGTPVVVDYPGAPDSTVVHWMLAVPLAPHDSLRVGLAWDARPSTVYRRQGRSGRTYDFAQWFPKVAVYDRRGWEPNAFRPAGELYGEFGTYDVTLVAADDQVLVATGVPVSGDPGWERVSRTGPPRLARDAYANLPPGPQVDVPAGSRAVRFVARDVHHFAWSASPDYQYEGGIYVRPASAHFPTWDTVSVHILFKPGDDTTWAGGRALDRTINALTWLESLYGPYGYPAFSVVHRLDRGATEFPMMIMNSSASYGLILHELGHNFTYGILANNEWRSAWMDEGLTEYQSEWAQRLTPQDHERNQPIVAPPLLPAGYRVNAVTIPRGDSAGLAETQLELLGRSQPVGTNSADFSEFGIYNDMVYNRASLMYGHLRDLMGDSIFIRFLHDYYDRWAFKHVDEAAMRASATRVYGQSLDWFFDQWLHSTGLLDYGLGPVSTHQSADSGWVTHVEIDRNGAYRHPMPVGIHTSQGWSIARARPDLDRQILEVTTPERPDTVEIDPYHVTWDWDRRNDERSGSFVGSAPFARSRVTPDWPFLNQSDRARTVLALAPRLWYSAPQGIVAGVSGRTNYLSMVDENEFGIAVAARSPVSPSGAEASLWSRFQLWESTENPYLPLLMNRPLIGVSAGASYLDGIVKWNAAKRWDLSPFLFANGPKIDASLSLTGAYPTEPLLLPEQWSYVDVTELAGRMSYRSPASADGSSLRASMLFGVGLNGSPDAASTVVGVGFSGSPGPTMDRVYTRVLGSLSVIQPLGASDRTLSIRLVAGEARAAPLQRSIFASSEDPFETFGNDYFRPQGALFKQTGVDVVPLGGAGMRGFSPELALDGVVAANAEVAQRLQEWKGNFGDLTLWADAFGDIGGGSAAALSPIPLSDDLLFDAGVGVSVRGALYDRTVRVRLDVPVFVNHSGAAVGTGSAVGGGSVALRWMVAFTDLW